MLKLCHRKRELLFMNLDGQRRSASYREVDSRINIPKVKWASWCDGMNPIAGGILAVTTQHLHEKNFGRVKEGLIPCSWIITHLPTLPQTPRFCLWVHEWIAWVSLWEPSLPKVATWKTTPTCNAHVYFWKFLYFILYKSNNSACILLLLNFCYLLYTTQFMYPSAIGYIWILLLLMTNEIEHLFICLWAVCVSSVPCLW